MDGLNFNIFNVIIIAGIIHGFIFSVIIFLNKNLKSKTNYYLAYTALALTFSNLQYWFIDVGIIQSNRYDNNDIIFVPFEFLMLPFFYLFVKNYLDKKTCKTEKVYLFTPFVISILYQIVVGLLKIEPEFIDIFNLIFEYISITFSVLIIVLVFRILLIYEKNHFEYSISNIIIKTKWLKRILYLGLLLCFLWFISLNIFDLFSIKGYYRFYPLWIGMTILVYWIGYTSIIQKHLFNERKEIRNKRSYKSSKRQHQFINQKPKTYSKINSLIIDNKLYLDPQLSLKLLSKKLNLSQGYIYQLINKNSNLNFNDYINTYRVNEAKIMLNNIEYKNYTILAIGLESGFNSKSSFYTAFKKFTGKTPIEYKKGVRNL